MLKNYLKIAFRSLLKNKIYTFINILGLSIGLASCLILFLILKFELSFDQFHSKHDSIYRIITKDVTANQTVFDSGTPLPLATAIKTDIPGIKTLSRVFFSNNEVIRTKDEILKVKGILYTDPEFFKIFDFRLLEGDRKKALSEPNTTIITESLAQKLFEGKSAIGKVITTEGKKDLVITGILEDFPSNSHLRADLLISFNSFEGIFSKNDLTEWGLLSSQSLLYAYLPPSVSAGHIENNLRKLEEKYLKNKNNEVRRFHLQPLSEIHFDTRTEISDLTKAIDKKHIATLSLIGVFILIVASVNFINLATVQSIARSKEIGIRKVIGASKKNVAFQFLGETFIIVFISVLIASLLVAVFINPINLFLEKNLSLDLLTDPYIIVFLISISIVVTLLSGFYPALILCGYQPIVALKNKIRASSFSFFVRQGLVVVQFSISLILIISTIIISQQLTYFKSRDLGFNKKEIVLLPLPDTTRAGIFKNKLLALPNIENVSFALGAPTGDNHLDSDVSLKDSRIKVENVTIKSADEDYLKTYNLKLLAGRSLNKKDRENAPKKFKENGPIRNIIINEKLSKLLGYKTPHEAIGTDLNPGFIEKAKIVGVVNDFHTASLHEAVQPCLILPLPFLYTSTGIKLKGKNVKESLAKIATTWISVFPNYPFEYEFLDDNIQYLYKSEENMGKIFKVFSSLAIIIGCLGLFGLSSFFALQKTKEIGIRKVLGASISGITLLLSKDLIKPVLIANFIAWPIAYIIMNKWLQEFAYKIEIGPGVFIITAVGTTIIAFFTLSFQSIKAAIANPVKSLKSE